MANRRKKNDDQTDPTSTPDPSVDPDLEAKAEERRRRVLEDDQVDDREIRAKAGDEADPEETLTGPATVCSVCGCDDQHACQVDRAGRDACAWVLDTPVALCDAERCLADSALQVWEDEDGFFHAYAPGTIERAGALAGDAGDDDPAAAEGNVFATDYNAKGESVDVPVMTPTPPATPTGEGQASMIDAPTMAMLRTGVWEPVDGYQPTSVELTFGGRVELSLNAHDRALANELRLNRKITVRAFARVDGRSSKVMRKKGAFDGITVKVPLFVYGLGLVAVGDGGDPDDQLGEETDELLLLNQVDNLTSKLEGIGESARDLLAGKVTLARAKAFIEVVSQLAPAPEATEPNDDPAPDFEVDEDDPDSRPAVPGNTPLEDAIREASESLDDPE